MKSFSLGLWCILFLSLESKELIRAQCFGPHFQMIFDLSSQLERHGVLLVQEKPDVLFCTEVSPKQLHGSLPIILFEKRGSPSPGEIYKRLLNHPNIIALFKNSVLRTRELYQKTLCNHSYHWRLFAQAAGVKHAVTASGVSPAQAQKIHCMPFYYSSAFSKRFDALRKITIDFDEERPIDVFFAGKLRDEGKDKGKLLMFTRHRRAAVKAIRAIEGIKSVVMTGIKPLAFDEYIELMRSSKIVVSPWGEGPWCFRDCEAMSCGAILVKPDTSFLRCYPDIFKDNFYYIPCARDFSNLQSVVRTLLAHYDDYQSLRKSAKDLMNSVSRDDLAQQFAAKVHELMFSYKQNAKYK